MDNKKRIIKRSNEEIINEAVKSEEEIEFDIGKYKSLHEITHQLFKQLQKNYTDEDIETISEGIKELLEKKDIEQEVYEHSDADEFYNDELL